MEDNFLYDSKKLLKKEMELSPFAQKSTPENIHRINPEKDTDEFRTPFQRDRDRIIHSRAFRRLIHKTQVFIATRGDHYRTRLTHTLEVMQIARSIARNLQLNEELTEAIALGHDLGHTPFGHIGERTLHKILSGYKFKDNIGEICIPYTGGFKHNFQSLHVVDNLEQVYDKFSGLNLTLAVREGILKHTDYKISLLKKDETGRVYKSKEEVDYNNLNLEGITLNKPSFSLEGQAVAVADEIAQRTHDLEDGFRAGFIDKEDLKQDSFVASVTKEFNIDMENKNTQQLRSTLIRKMIHKLVNDVLINTNKQLKEEKKKYLGIFPTKFDNRIIWFSETIDRSQDELQQLITDSVINSLDVSCTDCKAEFIIQQLFLAYYRGPQQMPDNILIKYFKPKKGYFKRKEITKEITLLQRDPNFIRLICDHISGMTDQYAFNEYSKLYLP